jgi:hypothetical protein
LHDQESHSGPEHNLKSIQDPIGFVALPALKGSDVFCGDLVGDEHEGLGALGVRAVLELKILFGWKYVWKNLPFPTQLYSPSCAVASS